MNCVINKCREEAIALQKRILKSVKGQQKDILISRLRAAEKANDKTEVERLLKQIQQNIHN
jgi:hypothetical protein